MSEITNKKANDSSRMGNMPMHKLFLSMSIPLIISMLVQTFYNIIDSVFVSYINEDALTAVSLVSPFMNLLYAVAAGTGIGFNAIIARRLGAKDPKGALRTANTGLFLIICSYVIFLIIGIIGTRAYIAFQTQSDSILEYGVTYMRIISCLSFGMFGQVAIERILQSTGKTIYPMITQMCGALINILFDYLLIFGIGPFPRLGVAGAALATIFGQCFAMGLGLYFNHRFNKEIHLSLAMIFHPDLSIIPEIYKIGLPSVLMISIGSIMTFGMNRILMAFSSTAVAVFGVYFKLQSVAFMPTFGMNTAVIPIVGYNLGAKKPDRIKKCYRIACLYACAVMWICLILFQVIPGKMLLAFNASENMLSIGIPALRAASIIFSFAGISVISSGLFQGSGKSIYSFYVSLIRQLAVLLPAAYLLSLSGNVNYVWFALPIAEVVGFITTLIFKHRLNIYLREVIS